MDDVNLNPTTLSDPKLDAAIAFLVERGRNQEAANFRREKLRRQFLLALNEAQSKDPHLSSRNYTVLVTELGKLTVV